MTPSEILCASRARLEADEAGPWRPGATGHALNGAYEHAIYMRALFFLRAACDLGPNGSLLQWDKDHGKKNALAAYDRAIEFAISQETANV